MRYLITGAGQIGTQLAADLTAAGHGVTVLRGGAGAVPGAAVRSGDAGDWDALRSAAAGAAAIFHCIHAAYSAGAWSRELPQRETAVMDVAAGLGIPVVFPESVYAFGRGARDLDEETPIAPVSPLGRVRARLLAARAAHAARTASIVASDLVGPTARPKASVILATVLRPAAAGRRALVMGDPDAPHAVTYLPDLARAMAAAVPLAEPGGAVLVAPTAPARSQRRMAVDAAAAVGRAPAGVGRIPSAALALGASVSPATRELFRQRYLWNAPSELRPGRLTVESGLEPTPWENVLREWAGAGSAKHSAA
ncbi:NAD-dependent epimerase/dehydratase family protein [Leucobacter sp. wl10]|uniref:NAD-dependent epimerase/dehydratase family protein n=1 Tax=Leucobacter sp. wl10 TaxID=2304677 RepID=UPI000E5B8604|nr:NAD-dependent epimerase/dehydratase family protein [Leucobacter sp. wl10]RGE23135.1 NAD-dependent epimerase/dehydratase family protein [Leucobacter sp. wl10]